MSDPQDKVAVIGLDAATWRIINPHDDILPTFKALCAKFLSTTLISDICRTHSAPVWTTMFSGIRAIEHRILDWTILGGPDSRLWTRNDIPVRFFWEYYPPKTAFAIAIPCVFPVLYYGYENPPLDMGLPSDRVPVPIGSVKDENDRVTGFVTEALKNPATRFVAAVYRTPDVACHLMDNKGRLEVYKHIDQTLDRLLPMLQGWKWLIVSDHGCQNLPGADFEVKLPPRKFFGNHHRDGILITNTPAFKSYTAYDVSRKLLNHTQEVTHTRLMHPRHKGG